VAVDIGGTFTDLVHEDPSGAVRAAKVLSTPSHFVGGVIDAVRQSGLAISEVDLFVHGTTAGLNAVLERRGARVALVTTRGFRDVYLIGRGQRPAMYDLRYHKPEPLLARAAIFEVDGRLAADGTEVSPIAEASVRATADAIRAGGFEAVAVCLMHAYVCPVHEQRVGELLGDELDVPVVLSHLVAPEWHEYERTSTTVMSAYMTPIMSSYIAELVRSLEAEGLGVPVYITQSNGGVMDAKVAARQSVLTLFCGPVGGVIGTQAAGSEIGLGDLISVDIGGTSFDVSIVRAGEKSLQSEFELQGLPILAPAVEVHTIGAGGGSLIRNVNGALRVGPESAGAAPGPACYGLGGMEPTVTDANVVLGRLPACQRLAGSMVLDPAAARQALLEVGRTFDLDAVALAEQALEIAHFAMAEAIRELTVERGLDPRDFVICAFGGAGGLHAAALAEELEISSVLLPALPGGFSAWGMLQSDLRHDSVQTFSCSLDGAAAEMPAVVDVLKARVTSLLDGCAVGGNAIRFDIAADLRYVGQEYALTLPLTATEVADFDMCAEVVAGRFHRAYNQRYGHASPGEPLEFVALRVAAVAALERAVVQDPRDVGNGADGTRPDGGRRASVRWGGRSMEAALHHRSELQRQVAGPVLVVEETSTTLVPPGWTAKPVTCGHLLLERQ
jgi:N-methylhydantoinase A